MIQGTKNLILLPANNFIGLQRRIPNVHLYLKYDISTRPNLLMIFNLYIAFVQDKDIDITGDVDETELIEAPCIEHCVAFCSTKISTKALSFDFYCVVWHRRAVSNKEEICASFDNFEELKTAVLLS